MIDAACSGRAGDGCAPAFRRDTPGVCQAIEIELPCQRFTHSPARSDRTLSIFIPCPVRTPRTKCGLLSREPLVAVCKTLVPAAPESPTGRVNRTSAPGPCSPSAVNSHPQHPHRLTSLPRPRSTLDTPSQLRLSSTPFSAPVIAFTLSTPPNMREIVRICPARQICCRASPVPRVALRDNTT